MGGMHPRARRLEGDDLGVELAVLRTERRTIEYLIDAWCPVEGTALAWSLSWLIERIDERIGQLMPPAPVWDARKLADTGRAVHGTPTVTSTPLTGQWTPPDYLRTEWVV